MGILYLVATPLGNLEDITWRAVRILREVSLIAAEDTRTTGKLLKHFEISCPLVSYHDYSKPEQGQRIIEALAQGDVALVSDAGTPLLSDPGYELVQLAIAQGVQVVSIPGPSALLTALPVSGLPINQFLFGGFLPRKASQRQQWLEQFKAQEITLIFYESPHRIKETLGEMVEILGADRLVAVCRELTKLHEEIWRGTLGAAYQEWSVREPRGEFTLVVAGATPAPTWNESQVQAALAQAKQAGLSSKDAARQVATQSGWAKREVYRLTDNIK